MFKVVYSIVIYFSLIYTIYYVILAAFAFLKTKNETKNGKINYFAILIAARNEEKVIKELIDSLKNQNYDKSKYEIDVIINNCTDSTREIAINNKVNVIDCTSKVTCKADALRIAFKELKSKKKIDAYIIFDADNVVHPDFLLNMNKSIKNGFRIAQGHRETKNLGKSWISSSYAIYFYLQNYMISRSRKHLGLSTAINGTGFMVKKDLIDEIGFNTKTLTEDIEFSAICALNRVKIDYVEDAITYDEQPESFMTSWHQRMRWTKGSLSCLRIYGIKLIKNFFKTRTITNLDMLFVFFSPIVQVITFLVILIDILIKIFNMGFIPFINSYILSSYISLIISYLITLILSSFVVLHNKHSLKEALTGIILFVLFIASWIPINIICLFKRKIEWKHIEHNANISINDVIKK